MDRARGLRAGDDRPLPRLPRVGPVVQDAERSVVASRSGWDLSRRDVPPTRRVTSTPPPGLITRDDALGCALLLLALVAGAFGGRGA